MMDSQNFWGEEWAERRAELQQIGALSELEKMIEDESIVTALQVFKDKLPDLFKQIKIEVVSPPKDDDLAGSPGVFFIDSKKDDLGKESFFPAIMVSGCANKINREQRKISLEMMAAKFGKQAKELSDRFLRIFIFFHEIGHSEDYVDHYATGASSEVATNNWRDQYNKEMVTLPIPGIMPSVAARIYEDSFGEPEQMLQHCVAHLNKYRPGFITDYQNYADIFFDNLKGNTLEQLLIDNERAYRLLPAEAYADNFAAEFLKQNKAGLDLAELK